MSAERNNGRTSRGSILVDGLNKDDLLKTAESQFRKTASVEEAMAEVLTQAYAAAQLEILDINEDEWDAMWLEFQELYRLPSEEEFEGILYSNYRLVTIWFALYETL